VIENFIRTWKNVIDVGVCQEIINAFDSKVEKHPEMFFDQSLMMPRTNLFRKDLSTDLDFLCRKQIVNLIRTKLDEHLAEYGNEFGQIKMFPLINEQLKVQRTMPQGGFHAWHFERSSKVHDRAREVVWTIYLNDMPPNEAETEFLYQSVKIRPEAGALCLFPAGMTHVHRGLTVYTQPKYIITGWFSHKLN